MRLKLHPPGAILTMLGVAIVAIFSASGPRVVAGFLFDLGGGPALDDVPSLAVAALGLFFSGCFGLLLCNKYVSIQTRVSEFQRALPFPRTTLIRDRAMATWLTLAAPVVFTFLVLAVLTRPAVDSDPDSVVVSMIFGFDGLWPLALGAKAAVTALAAQAAAVASHYAYRPARCQLSRGEMVQATALALFVVITPLILFPSFATLFYLAAVAKAAQLIRRNGDESDEISADDVRQEAIGRWGRSEEFILSMVGQTRWVLLRSTIGRPRSAFAYTAILTIVVVAGLEGYGGRMLAFMVVLAGLTNAAVSRNLHEGLDPLPLPRRRILAWMLIPSLALPVLTLGFTSLGYQDQDFHRSVPRHQVQLRRPLFADGETVLVPYALWANVEVGGPATIRAPWGEVWQPTLLECGGKTMSIYNPYGTTGDNTVQFARWQLARATAAGGRPIAAEVLEVEVMPGLDPSTRLADVRYDDRANWSTEIPRGPWWGHFARLETVLLILLWGLAARFILRSTHPTRGWRISMHKTPRLMGFALFLPIYPMIAGPLIVERETLASAEHLVVRWLDRALGGSPVLWLAICLAVAWATYRWVSRAVAAHEIPPQLGWAAGGPKARVF